MLLLFYLNSETPVRGRTGAGGGILILAGGWRPGWAMAAWVRAGRPGWAGGRRGGAGGMRRGGRPAGCGELGGRSRAGHPGAGPVQNLKPSRTPVTDSGAILGAAWAWRLGV